jgi:hypothetical protein
MKRWRWSAHWRQEGRAQTMNNQEWIEQNAPKAAEALAKPEVQDELYALLGGQPDPDSEREQVIREVSRLRLHWRPRQ